MFCVCLVGLSMSPGSLRAICSAWGGSGACPSARPAGGLLVACRDSERCLWLAAAQSRGHLVLVLPLLGVTVVSWRVVSLFS